MCDWYTMVLVVFSRRLVRCRLTSVEEKDLGEVAGRAGVELEILVLRVLE